MQSTPAFMRHMFRVKPCSLCFNLLPKSSKHLKVMHQNTQSMVSTFDELVLTIKEYFFDVITMSETWLKDNLLLLQHVTIPGYSCEFRNRESLKGSRVGVYIRECEVQVKDGYRGERTRPLTPMASVLWM